MSLNILKDKNLLRKNGNFHNIFCDEFFEQNLTYCKLVKTKAQSYQYVIFTTQNFENGGKNIVLRKKTSEILVHLHVS